MLNKFKKILYLATIVIILCAFNFAHNLTSGWQRQDLPNIGGRQILDMCFTDSLNGFMITNPINDSAYILKTTNSGFNWNINYISSSGLLKVQFINDSMGYVLSINKIYKTSNRGINWSLMLLPLELYPSDIYVLNEDTIWATDVEAKTGGIFRTTNGGQNWVRQFYSGGLPNPDKVYFFNKNLGFASRGRLLRTSNGGENWVNMTPEDNYMDIEFADSLIGWKVLSTSVKKTTNGGLNWVSQNFPPKSDRILFSRMYSISVLNKDTVWSVGGVYWSLGNLFRGMIYKTTDGGLNWGYQVDTNISIGQFFHIQFINGKTGWCYDNLPRGVYTNVGGSDTTIFTSIKNISNEIPIEYKLEQNYPNPFNPTTKIKFSVKGQVSDVKLIVYDVTGRIISELVNEKLSSGTYESDFIATGLSSGIYFYTLTVNNFKETKKMLLLK